MTNFSSNQLRGDDFSELETEFGDFESNVEIAELQPIKKGTVPKGITRKFTNFINPSK